MLEVLYRIYQVEPYDEDKDRDLELTLYGARYESISKARNSEIVMDCCVCESREHFKGIIKSMYGDNIKFANSKKLKIGDLYCIIIGEHAYNSELYFSKMEYECDQCKSQVTTFVGKQVMISESDAKYYLYSMFEKYKSHKFCSQRCKMKFLEEEQQRVRINDDDEFFVNREMFNNKNITGYIYKIIKIDTQEQYIGQSRYIPMFRWAQHLKTDRFNEKNILNYHFEILRIVNKGENILNVEKEYIKKLIEEIGEEKCLNIVHNSKEIIND